MKRHRHLFLTITNSLPVILSIGLAAIILGIFVVAAVKAGVNAWTEHPYEMAFRFIVFVGIIAVALGWNWMLERFFGEEHAEDLALTAWIPIVLLGTLLFGFTNTVNAIFRFFKSLWSGVL